MEHCRASLNTASNVLVPSNCCATKALPVKYQTTAHRPCIQAMHAGHVPKTKFATLLSTKELIA